MKKITVILLISSFLLFSNYFTQELEARSYTMRCRGGDVTLAFGGKNYPSKAKLIIVLKKAKNHKNLGPDECAWLDRPLSAKEQSKLYTGWFKYQGLDILFKRDRIKEFWSSRKDMKLVLDKIKSGGEYFLQVENKKGVMKITKFGL